MQTAVLMAWKAKNPKEALAMIIGGVLALHPDAADALPNVIIRSHGERVSSPLEVPPPQNGACL